MLNIAKFLKLERIDNISESVLPQVNDHDRHTLPVLPMQAEDRQGCSSLPEVKSVNSDMPTSRHASVEYCDQQLQPTYKDRPKPYITDCGSLVIPFDSDPKYHYWKPGGQSLLATLQELNADKEMIRRYKSIYSD